MNKKGFTLVELLAVIVIIGLIVTLSATAIIRSYKSGKEKIKYEAAEEIVTASESYFASRGGKEVSVKDLICIGYIDQNLTNPRNNKTVWNDGEKHATIIKRDTNIEKQDGYKVQDCDEGTCYKFDGIEYIMPTLPISDSENDNCDSDPVPLVETSEPETEPESATEPEPASEPTSSGSSSSYSSNSTSNTCSCNHVNDEYNISCGNKKVRLYTFYKSCQNGSTNSSLPIGTGSWKKSITIDLTNVTSSQKKCTYNVKYEAKNSSQVYNCPVVTYTRKDTSSETLENLSNSLEESLSGLNDLFDAIGQVTELITSGCLVEGTKVKLANGYKNIEDIEYNDLLETWNYDTGQMVYEYPIWIEKPRTANSYQETKFSDGSVLKTVSFHGVFNKDLNKFVSVDDKKNFKVGTTVAKIENGKIKYVKVVSIKKIRKRIKYYHVESTRYYNIIANDFLTTDGYVVFANIYKFGNNITWLNNKEVMNNQNNLYEYKEFNNKIPYYLFKGLRMTEAKYLENEGLVSKNQLVAILKGTMVNSFRTKKPITKNGNRYWMVTLDSDIVTSQNRAKYLIKEGNYYKLPSNGDSKTWYNSSDNKYYKSGDKVKVFTSMHFTEVK